MEKTKKFYRVIRVSRAHLTLEFLGDETGVVSTIVHYSKCLARFWGILRIDSIRIWAIS